MIKKLFIALTASVALIIGVAVYLFYTNEGVANEFRQVRQPKPNLFYVGIDVSATIDPVTLKNLKENIVSRLKNFIGEETVSYHVGSFGSPGCAQASLKSVVSGKAPKDEVTFDWEVKKKIDTIKVSQINGKANRGKPLTTPLNYFLNTVLPKRSGGRIIIFSDLMNDDSDCSRQTAFPELALTKFGEDTNGQLIFLYPTPSLTGNPKLNRQIMERQQKFIRKMQNLVSKGKIRAYFFHIPDEPEKRADFIRSQLKNSIPATNFEVIWERTTKVIGTMVSAARG